MYIQYLKDVANFDFLGFNISEQLVEPYLLKMKKIINDEYDEYRKYQKERDNGYFHCTLFNVAEYNKIKRSEKINEIISQYIDDIKLIGLGTATNKGHVSYFIVVNSEKLQNIRKEFGFENKDFHITLGFKYKDVHGVRKNEIIKDKGQFLVTLKQYYFDFDQSFDFCRYLDNFNYSIYDEILCTKITETYAEFKILGEKTSNRFTITLKGIDNFNISCKWNEENNKSVPLDKNKIKDIL